MKKIITLFILISFLFINKHHALVRFSIPFFNMPQNHVRIDFINNANEEIVEIKFNDKKASLKNIAINQRKTILLKNVKKNDYTYSVVFKSGKKIKSNGAYIEGGYFIREYILNYTTKIKQSFL